MDIFDIGGFIILTLLIVGVVYGVTQWEEYKEIRQGGLKSDVRDMEIMHGKGMQYKGTVNQYMLGYVTSPCTCVIVDKTELQ